jgi:hypothetical protein
VACTRACRAPASWLAYGALNLTSWHATLVDDSLVYLPGPALPGTSPPCRLRRTKALAARPAARRPRKRFNRPRLAEGSRHPGLDAWRMGYATHQALNVGADLPAGVRLARAYDAMAMGAPASNLEPVGVAGRGPRKRNRPACLDAPTPAKEKTGAELQRNTIHKQTTPSQVSVKPILRTQAVFISPSSAAKDAAVAPAAAPTAAKRFPIRSCGLRLPRHTSLPSPRVPPRKGGHTWRQQ